MKMIEGGVCAAKGFRAGACHCGIRKSMKKNDLAVIVSEVVCSVAATYTSNRVKAAPLLLTKEHLADGKAIAAIVNSGNANACATDGMENAAREARAAANFLKVNEEDVVVASTGVIGQRLKVECIEEHVGDIVLKDGIEGSMDAARAIMTTDTAEKIAAVEFEVDGHICHLGGICKGSGMIHPNMGTMLSFVTTDCAITSEMLQKALRQDVKKTYNRVTVDGDTSTNDMCVLFANGLAGNPEIATEDCEAFAQFCEALHAVNEALAKKIAADGEGATHLMTCTVTGAKDEETAEVLAKSICSSSLVKAAMFGADANWGRVLCAMGYSGAEFNTEDVTVSFLSRAGKIVVYEHSVVLDFDEDLAKKILSEDDVEILAELSEGDGNVSCWGCDLTYDYVKINGDYRT
ncbi:MAG: bifunctional ornithine acetyltransferase/N-acetylglutamate synthase [bacterium]|nr:bifunctional ornithine acetyltransferase/N-acetylglutamate synthase [bacterium]